ncbi:MAG: nucleoside-triphosphatase [Aquaticitalea sp.]
MIYILTGDIRTGKTTALMNWAKTRADVDGLLCPDGFNGKRYFFKLKNREHFVFEVDAEIEEEHIAIGNFKFLKSSFETANDYLLASSDSSDFKYFVLDELGKLELQNEGLHHSALKIIRLLQSNMKKHLILVVRSALLLKVIKHYHIQIYELVSIEDLSKNRLA